jgi:predicted homoserine dehydrogenase-like protein
MLKNHLYERAHNILKQAEAIETMNQTRIINEVMNETFASVDKAYSENKEQIEKEMFSLALEGIARGKMDYAKDPILPYIVKTIQKTVDKFNSISPEEQKKLVTLTQ